jgi:hypothetical protein
MQGKYMLQIALVILFMAGSFLVLSSASKPENGKEACSESLEECSKNKGGGTPAGEIIWENFSRQFISVSSEVCP